MKIQELTQYLDELLQVKRFKDYCPNGLQVSGKHKIKKIAFAVSATLDSIQKSIKWEADALITHHGILWNYDGAQVISGPFKERIKLLLDHQINLISYHLPLDAHNELGNAAQLIKYFSAKNMVSFGDYKGCAVGMKAEFNKPLKLPLVLKKLETVLNHNIICAEAKTSLIKSFAIVTGGGASYYKEAYDQGMDLFITGEMSEYHWHGAKELGIHLVAGGHHATERGGVLALAAHIQKKFHLQTQYFDSDNPI